MVAPGLYIVNKTSSKASDLSTLSPVTELFGELVGNHHVFYSIYVKVLAKLVSMDRHTPDRSVRT